MSEPFLAEIKIVAFNFAPRGWAFCDGQILPINQNQSLYSLLGTTYGGDGRTTFGLPELRGRTPVHPDGSIFSEIGDKAGEETVALTAAEMPSHRHSLSGTSATGSSPSGAGQQLAATGGGRRAITPYAPLSSVTAVTMNSSAVANAGAGQGHNNMQPCLALNFCIALQGLFPSRN